MFDNYDLLCAFSVCCLVCYLVCILNDIILKFYVEVPVKSDI